MLTEKQDFKAAFIAQCVEHGFTSPEVIADQASQAQEKLAGILHELSEAGKGLAGTVSGYGIPLLLAAPPIAGAVLGGTMGKMTDIDDVDVQEAKNQEILAELRRQTQRLQHKRKAEEFARSRR